VARLKSFSAELERTRKSDEVGRTSGAFEATDHFLKPTDCCFFCGEPLTDDVVYWSGRDDSNTQIWLHPSCARALSQHLAKDGQA
jgi:hypothetical protein